MYLREEILGCNSPVYFQVKKHNTKQNTKCALRSVSVSVKVGLSLI